MSEIPLPPEPTGTPESRVVRGHVDRSRAERAAAREAAMESVAPEVGAETVSTTVEVVESSDVTTPPTSRIRSNVKVKDEPPVSRLRGSGVRKNPGADSSPRDTVDITAERHIPTFNALRPEHDTVKTYSDKDGLIDLRLSSNIGHQDGLAYNPDSDTVVVCDGMGGPGEGGDVKDFFGFALSHATAELDDISTLADPNVVKTVVERAKSILGELGIPIEARSRIRSHPIEWGSTIAAVQRVPDSPDNRWRVATIGDSSVVILDASGKIKRGFGETFQTLGGGSWRNTDGDALGSYVGMAKGTLDGYVSFGSGRGHAEFTEVNLDKGEKLVVVSDAYVQKTDFAVLESDAALTPEQWKAKKPKYEDDTTMAIVSSM